MAARRHAALQARPEGTHVGGDGPRVEKGLDVVLGGA